MIDRRHRFTLSIVGLLGVGLLMGGALGPWLDFPLSASLFPKELPLPWPEAGETSLRTLMLGLGLLAGIGWLLRVRLLTLGAGLVAAVVLIHFVHTWMLHDQWMLRYLSESEQREALKAFLSNYYWPNLNPEPTVRLETDFEYLTDQLRVFWYSSGWGFSFCVVGLILLLLDQLMATPAVGLTSLVILVNIAAVVMLWFFPLFNAELKQRSGDELLGSGQLRDAISTYATSLRMNPALEYSKRFLHKASRAYYQMEGENSLLGGLYLASTRSRWQVGQPLIDTARETLDHSAKILSLVLHSSYQGSLLERAILRQSAQEYRKVRVEQGLDALASGQPSLSLSLFQEAFEQDRRQVHIGFFLAHVQRELGLVSETVATLETTLQQVEHTSIRADLWCSLGDALSRGRQPLEARHAYVQCLEADSLFNFRAILSLGGT